MSQERPDGWRQGILCGLCRWPPERLQEIQSMEDELCHGHDLIHILEFWQDTSTLVLENNQLATDVMIMVRQ
jgi:hypothetical protein